MREKPHLSDEAFDQIAQLIRDTRSDVPAVRMKARDQLRRFHTLYGREAIETVEEEVAAAAWEESIDRDDPNVIYE
ncbi:hypothetical protein [Rhizobium laguerreae]|uniref:hypothetical protein n=1 Tax=Rhizobium laguerreae TaxID=1076926 RepID=UPI001C90130E|nr:hypothetical protein [Rhizobium laguerreae]MBY3231904.1 hypothetical protein [Rhizobium laguerreae]